MRWLLSIALTVAGTFLWLGMLVADPYTAWGVKHEQIRPSVVEIGINLGLAALACFAAATAILFSVRANRTSKYGRFYGGIVLFLFATTLARLYWVWFVVSA
jgi:hypothetical protein